MGKEGSTVYGTTEGKSRFVFTILVSAVVKSAGHEFYDLCHIRSRLCGQTSEFNDVDIKKAIAHIDKQPNRLTNNWYRFIDGRYLSMKASSLRIESTSQTSARNLSRNLSIACNRHSWSSGSFNSSTAFCMTLGDNLHSYLTTILSVISSAAIRPYILHMYI